MPLLFMFMMFIETIILSATVICTVRYGLIGLSCGLLSFCVFTCCEELLNYSESE